jgi:hypothetical protein
MIYQQQFFQKKRTFRKNIFYITFPQKENELSENAPDIGDDM